MNVIELKGLGVSRGKYKGKAIVIKDIENIEEIVKKLENVKGEYVLIIPTTTPEMIILFDNRLKAIVSEHGGITTHPAILAREFCIPGVVAVKNVIKIVEDGDLVEIDGDNGIVRIYKGK